VSDCLSVKTATNTEGSFKLSRLPLRVAIELLSSKVDQLCHFITEHGLQAPQLPHEKETALKKILGNLGLNEASSISLQPTDCEPENLPDASSDPTTCLPNVFQMPLATPKEKPKGPGADLFTGKGVGPESHATYTSLPPTAHEDSAIPFNEDPQSSSGDSPSSILSSWDLCLGFGTCITPAPLDLQHLFGSPSENAPGVELEEVPLSPAPIISQDDSTLDEGSGSTTEVESLIDEISDRVGALRIGPRGKTHFCGPTSTFNLTRPTTERYSLQAPDHFVSEKDIPPWLEEHLTNLYFSWQDPSFHVVDRKMYEAAKAKWQNTEDTPFYSEALRFAM
jgi:hypothetical protein